MSRHRDAMAAEHRADRPRNDEKDAGHVVHPNGTHIASQHWQFLAAAARAVLAAHDATRAEAAA